MASSGGKKGGKKIGRGMKSPAHNRYNTMGKREQNKIKKIKRHLRRCGDDHVAEKALKKLNG